MTAPSFATPLRHPSDEGRPSDRAPVAASCARELTPSFIIAEARMRVTVGLPSPFPAPMDCPVYFTRQWLIEEWRVI